MATNPIIPGKPIDQLIEVMKRLRDPDSGCPWDIKQTFDTIAPYTIEEAYEVVDAIERKDLIDLKNELGDLLLQVVYHSQIASEIGAFVFDDVAKSSSEKMVSRHPHVFAGKPSPSPFQHQVSWENRKAKERNSSNISSGILDGIAETLPALLRAYKLQKRAANIEFDWPNVQDALKKLKEEIGELESELSQDKEKTNKDRLTEELADIIFSAVNVGRKLGIEPESALRQGNKKFEKRFKYVEKKLSSDGKQIENASLDQMEKYWLEAKSKFV